MGISSLRPFLQSLCCNSPWNYAVFWKLKHQHEMILVSEDGFCDILKPKNSMMDSVEDSYLENSNKILSIFNSSVHDGTPVEYSVGLAVTEMSRAFHVVGKGLVGNAAYTGNACWIYSDSIATDLLESVLVTEYPDEWLLQLAAGIKTVLLVPVSTGGVLQLGSMEMVAEDASLVAYVKDKFEAHKESDIYNWRLSTQQFSPMSTFMENFEEPSTITTENLYEGHKFIHADKTKDCDLFANQMMQVITVQDLCNTPVWGVANTIENVIESEIRQQALDMMHVAEPPSEDNKCTITENNISKSAQLDERLRAFPYCDNFDWGTYGDFVNELMDINFEKGATEPFMSNDFDNACSEHGNNSFSFPRDFELQKALGPAVGDHTYQYTYDSSISSHNVDRSLVHDKEPFYHMDTSGVGSTEFSTKQVVDMEHILESVLANERSSSDDNSSDKSNVTSCNMLPGKLLASSKIPCQSKRRASVEEDTVSWSFFTSAFTDQEKSLSSVESRMSVLADRPQLGKVYDSLNPGKLSRLSSTNKRKVRGEDNQRPRPRDRQLIQDRIKELRKLVPNSEKSSIDGLLDKTIKHMMFLRGVTDQADKLRRHILKEEADEKITKTAEVKYSHQNGTSWAVELGNEQQLCPIVVKDLDHPGHMLIEMLCTDHGRFLEIADVIHRLKLTILKGIMEKSSDDSWARFVVEYLLILSNADLGKLPSPGYLLAADATVATNTAAYLKQDLSLSVVILLDSHVYL
ncbi:hypothetical protein BUALT_Bualt09G0116400 [Buddleja alternifolia]|uniref:BHLH domain-containing protein n=1 Tax=Buddleja alternifolia TaxID=168488 RepID=A0AAV6X2B2_9LAMI|nr:hypothetical protein BUALT_Bualt09G0116400 [Buddleja alternifolia]